MVQNQSGVTAWKELVEQLPGILSVEFVLESEAVREVHVLSDQSRTPKQLVRDIQSALLAQFQLELDHRIVSVAQIPGIPKGEQHRLICDRLELSSARNGCEVSVSLRMGDKNESGTSASDLSVPGRSRAIAQATVDAINCFLAAGCRFYLEDARSLTMGNRTAVLVGLRLENSGRTEELLGACFQGDDPNFSIATATLDAVNRRLLLLPLSK